MMFEHTNQNTFAKCQSNKTKIELIRWQVKMLNEHTCLHRISRKVSSSASFSLKPRLFFNDVTLRDPNDIAEP